MLSYENCFIYYSNREKIAESESIATTPLGLPEFWNQEFKIYTHKSAQYL